jgi:preprotein translocase subunit SecA
MNFDIRKQLLEYDNVMNKQREVIYTLRNQILDGQEVSKNLDSMIQETLEEKLDQWAPVKEIPDNWDINAFHSWVTHTFNQENTASAADWSKMSREELQEAARTVVQQAMAAREKELGAPLFNQLQRMVLLQMIDVAWKEHLYDLDQLKKGISLRAYAQKDPLIEFQHEAFNLFSQMMNRIREQTLEYLFKMHLAGRAPVEGQEAATPPALPMPRSVFAKAQAVKPDFLGPSAPGSSPLAAPPEPVKGRRNIFQTSPSDPVDSESPERSRPVTVPAKIGRNDPCPCGSGKKYKKCHGK